MLCPARRLSATHASAVSPVLNDAKGKGSSVPVVAPEGHTAIVNRCCLHSSRLALVHPSNATPVELTADLPSDFESVLEILRSGISRDS